MRLGMLVLFTSAAIAAAALAGAEATRDRSCSCPQASSGWLLFADSNWRTPDFWREDEVVVQEISACRHGVQFLFMAAEGGNPHLVALVFANPAASARLLRRSDLARMCERYAALRRRVNLLLDGALEPSGRLDFQGTPLDDHPRILRPSSRLTLVWRGEELELRGYLDVYMTLLV